VRPAPYGGPSCPAPTRGAGAEFCARPLMGGRTPPPPRGGLGRHLLGLGLGLALGLGLRLGRDSHSLVRAAAGRRRRLRPHLRHQGGIDICAHTEGVSCTRGARSRGGRLHSACRKVLGIFLVGTLGLEARHAIRERHTRSRAVGWATEAIHVLACVGGIRCVEKRWVNLLLI